MRLIVGKGHRPVTHERLQKQGFPGYGTVLSFDEVPDLSEFPYKREIERYIEGIHNHVRQGIGLYLWGPYGSGKSSLAYLIGKHAMEAFRLVYVAWIRCRDVPKAAIEGRMFDDEWTWHEYITRCHFLVIDDFDLRGRSAADDYVEDLIRIRCEERRSTVITSNLIPSKIPSPAICSLLMDRLYPIEIDGKDWRRDNRIESLA